MAALALLLACVAVAAATDSTYYVCAAGDETFLGGYAVDGTREGASIYTNGDGRSIFRNNGRWYLGDLTPWPPETHYRPGADTAIGTPMPPLEGYETGRGKFGTLPAPVLSEGPCEGMDEL